MVHKMTLILEIQIHFSLSGKSRAMKLGLHHGSPEKLQPQVIRWTQEAGMVLNGGWLTEGCRAGGGIGAKQERAPGFRVGRSIRSSGGGTGYAVNPGGESSKDKGRGHLPLGSMAQAARVDRHLAAVGVGAGCGLVSSTAGILLSYRGEEILAAEKRTVRQSAITRFPVTITEGSITGCGAGEVGARQGSIDQLG